MCFFDELVQDYGRNTKRILIGQGIVVQSNSMLVLHRLKVLKMADVQRELGPSGNINILNGLQFFNRTDDLTVSNVGLAAREGNEEALKQLLARGEYFSF